MKKSLSRILAGICLLGAASINGCGRGVPDADYTVIEHLGSKFKTVGVGYKYDFKKGDEKGETVYTIEPSYKDKFKKALLADSYFLKDKEGNILYNVDGKILTISATHKVYDADGNFKKEISRIFGGDLLGRLGRLVLKRDGYYVKDKNGFNMLDVRETWNSVLSPFLREYKIFNPDTNKEIGIIRNKFRGGSLLGAQTYQISLDEKTQENLENLALAIRIIDGVEDMEEESSDSSSSSESSD